MVWLSIATAMSLVLGGATIGEARSGSGRTCGAAWTVAPQPAISGSGGLEDVAASSSTDAWAVGHRFDSVDHAGHVLIEHHDGTMWTISPSTDGPAAVQSALSGVAARTASDAWAVGSFTRANNLVRTLIEHWDGTAWTRVKSPNAGQPAGGDLSGVAALAADDVWAVGGYGQGGTRENAHRALGRIGVVARPEPEQGSVPELPVGRHRDRVPTTSGRWARGSPRRSTTGP